MGSTKKARLAVGGPGGLATPPAIPDKPRLQRDPERSASPEPCRGRRASRAAGHGKSLLGKPAVCCAFWKATMFQRQLEAPRRGRREGSREQSATLWLISNAEAAAESPKAALSRLIPLRGGGKGSASNDPSSHSVGQGRPPRVLHLHSPVTHPGRLEIGFSTPAKDLGPCGIHHSSPAPSPRALH